LQSSGEAEEINEHHSHLEVGDEAEDPGQAKHEEKKHSETPLVHDFVIGNVAMFGFLVNHVVEDVNEDDTVDDDYEGDWQPHP
jgi:hypothetical protein